MQEQMYTHFKRVFIVATEFDFLFCFQVFFHSSILKLIDHSIVIIQHGKIKANNSANRMQTNDDLFQNQVRWHLVL